MLLNTYVALKHTVLKVNI